jgi:hypothetical protein
VPGDHERNHDGDDRDGECCRVHAHRLPAQRVSNPSRFGNNRARRPWPTARYPPLRPPAQRLLVRAEHGKDGVAQRRPVARAGKAESAVHEPFRSQERRELADRPLTDVPWIRRRIDLSGDGPDLSTRCLTRRCGRRRVRQGGP